MSNKEMQIHAGIHPPFFCPQSLSAPDFPKDRGLRACTLYYQSLERRSMDCFEHFGHAIVALKRFFGEDVQSYVTGAETRHYHI